MSGRRRWTPEELAVLQDGWGTLKGGMPALARRLGRSVYAVKIKATKLKLGPWLEGGDWISVNQLIRAVTGCRSYTYTLMRWTRMGLPVSLRRTEKCRWRMVRIEDFWLWAEAHRSELNFSRFEEGLLGIEPEWARKKRRVDQRNRTLSCPHNVRWSAQEDALLRLMCENGTTWAELDGSFRRTSGAIRLRIHDLKLPRPKDMGRRGLNREKPWSAEELETLSCLTDEGYSIDWIARKLGRTSQSVRGKCETLRYRERMSEDG